MDPHFLDPGTTRRRVIIFTARSLYPRGRAPGTHWIGDWVDPGIGLDDLEERKSLTRTPTPQHAPCSRFQQYFECCMRIRFRGKVFTEPLPRNGSGMSRSYCIATAVSLAPQFLLWTNMSQYGSKLLDILLVYVQSVRITITTKS
jgi:hypothetical protein